MAWIETIAEDAAEGKLAAHYERVRKTSGGIGNFSRGYSLRPHMYEAMIGAYQATCFHKENTLPPWFHEAIATYVSVLNGCAYCTAHHQAAILKHAPNRTFALAVIGALSADDPAHVFDGNELAALFYVRKLTVDPASIEEDDIVVLRDAGLDDGEILEINQTAGVFAWANRYVSGLGISIAGEDLD